MSEYLPGIIWLMVLLVVNAFFVGTEFAASRPAAPRIEPKAEDGSKAAKTTLRAMANATLMLVTFLHVVLEEMVPKNISFSVPT